MFILRIAEQLISYAYLHKYIRGVFVSSPYLSNKKDRSDSVNRIQRYGKNLKNFIRLSLRKSSCNLIEILACSIPVIHLWNKKKSHSNIFIRSQVFIHKFCGRTDGRVDIFPNNFVFASTSCPFISWLNLIFYSLMNKVSIPFSILSIEINTFSNGFTHWAINELRL